MKTAAESRIGIQSTYHEPEVSPRYAYVLPLAGALIGSAVPVAYGVWILHAFYSKPPLASGEADCGLPVLGAMASILVGTPIGTVTAAAGGLALGLFVDWVRWLRSRA